MHLESDVTSWSRLEALADAVEELFADVERVLTPFRDDSELAALNRDGRPQVPASPLLAELARAARRAATQTRGLVDATVPVGTRPRPAVRPDLAALLAAAPPRRAARPADGWRARQPSVDRDGRVCRPAGVTLDPGGLAKGLAADRAAALMPPGVAYAIGCGGDLAVGGRRWEIGVDGVRGVGHVHRLRVDGGGVATSGIHARAWRDADGHLSHHILDPATGRPAWTGLVAVTAVAACALDAEILAKGALLSGPRARAGCWRSAAASSSTTTGRPRSSAACGPRGWSSRHDERDRPLRPPVLAGQPLAGILAWLALSASMVIGLSMATKVAPRSMTPRLRVAHERVASSPSSRSAPMGCCCSVTASYARPSWTSSCRSASTMRRSGPDSGRSPATSRPRCRCRTTRGSASVRAAGVTRTAGSRSRGARRGARHRVGDRHRGSVDAGPVRADDRGRAGAPRPACEWSHTNGAETVASCGAVNLRVLSARLAPMDAARRLRPRLLPIAQTALAAVVAYYIAQLVPLDDPRPTFASIARSSASARPTGSAAGAPSS